MERLNYREAAEFLGVKLPTLQSMVCREQVPHVRLSGRLVVFERDALEKFIAERRVSPKGDRG